MDPKILRFHIAVAQATKQNDYWTFNPKPPMLIIDQEETFNYKDWEDYLSILSKEDNESLIARFNNDEEFQSISDQIIKWLVSSCKYDLQDISFNIKYK